MRHPRRPSPLRRWLQWSIIAGTLGLVLLVFLLGTVAALNTDPHAPTRAKEPRLRLFLEALIGWWPAETVTQEPWLVGLGVAIDALAVFGIPFILGAVISWMLRHSAGGIAAMLGSRYLDSRDRYFSEIIYARVLGLVMSKLPDAEPSPALRQEVLNTVQGAMEEASREWNETVPQAFQEALNQIDLAGYRQQR